MEPASARRSIVKQAPYFLRLPSLDSKRHEPWSASLESDILTLYDAGSRQVLQLHRREAARYMRFSFDLFRGRTVSLAIIQGIKSYSFACGRDNMTRLLQWLPRLEPAEIRSRMRKSAVVMLLLGALHFALPAALSAMGAGLMAVAGAVGAVRPRPGLYAVNALLLALVGLWDLLTGTFQEALPWDVPAHTRWVAVAMGCLLLLWAVHQATMLTPNQQLRVSRRVRDQNASFLPQRSALVRVIGFSCVAAAVAAGAYAALMAISAAQAPLLNPQSVVLGRVPIDTFGFALFALLAAVEGGALLLRRPPPRYAEAKAAGQALVAALALTIAGVAFKAQNLMLLAYGGGFLGDGLAWLASPWVWAPMLVLVLAFNTWFTRTLDRELEEQRS